MCNNTTQLTCEWKKKNSMGQNAGGVIRDYSDKHRVKLKTKNSLMDSEVICSKSLDSAVAAVTVLALWMLSYGAFLFGFQEQNDSY